jgi:hypothetical protein
VEVLLLYLRPLSLQSESLSRQLIGLFVCDVVVVFDAIGEEFYSGITKLA